MSDNVYILLVHGTWTSSPGWHSDQAERRNFCAALKDELRAQGVENAIWRTGNVGSSEFNWSGLNKHEDRIAAGISLAEKIRVIIQNDPQARISVVAHSHGCNVTLKAIETYLRSASQGFAALMFEISQQAGGTKDLNAAIEKVFGSDHAKIRAGNAKFFDRLQDALKEESTFEHLSMSPEGQLVSGFVNSDLNQELENLWFNSSRNRLGSIVFLGPPFLKKVWSPRGQIAGACIKGLDFMLGATAVIVASYILSLVLWTLIWLLSAPFLWLFRFDFLGSPSYNPNNWNVWLAGAVGALVALIALLVGSDAASSSKRKNGNLYFSADQIGIPESSTAIEPIPSLVVTADLLDEVLLGFSSEPIVYGALLPRIREFFNPAFSWKLPPKPIGYEGGMSEFIWDYVALAGRGAAAVGWFLIRPITKIWERVWTKRLIQLISAAAYGLQLHELERALVVATSRLDEPKFFQEHLWDVTKVLVEGSFVGEAVARSERYSFLWNLEQRGARQEESWIWKSISPYRDEIERRYSSFPQAGIGAPEQLSKACVVLEERFQDAVGAAGLMHTAYQSNEVVVKAVSDFILHGGMPVDTEFSPGAAPPPSS